eukprot:6635677-Pyramimonas_sp.AAC.1
MFWVTCAKLFVAIVRLGFVRGRSMFENSIGLEASLFHYFCQQHLTDCVCVLYDESCVPQSPAR